MVLGILSDSKDLIHLVDALLDVSEKLTNLKALFLGDIHDCRNDYLAYNINISYILLAYPNLEIIKNSVVMVTYTYFKNTIGIRNKLNST